MRYPVLFFILLVTGTALAQVGSSKTLLPVEAPSYEIKASLTPEQHLLEVSGTVIITAVTSRSELVYALSDKAAEVAITVKEPIGLTAKVAKNERTNVPGGLQRWTMNFDHPIAAGAKLKLSFTYKLQNALDSIFYIGPEGSFASGINTAWYPQIEDLGKFRMRGTGSLSISVPGEEIVYVAGTRNELSRRPKGLPYTNRVDKAQFFSFVAGKYTLARRVIGGLPVVALSLGSHRGRNIQGLVTGCSKVIKALSTEFGKYPYPEFAVAEMPTAQARRGGSDGASLSGMILGISGYFDQEFNTAFYGHEIGHTWWGNLVQKKGVNGSYMLDEAMANYGSLRAVEMIHGEAEAERYRRTGSPGYYAEYSGSQYLFRSLAGLDHTLVNLPLSNGFLSRRLANTKGMLTWDLLSRTIGRARFQKILHDFTASHALERVTWEDFLSAVERGSNKKLEWFYDQWFNRTGAPDFRLDWTQNNGSVEVKIAQSAPLYRADLEIELTGEKGQRRIKTIELREAALTFNWPIPFKVKEVKLDPHFKMLRWTPEYRVDGEALLPYTLGELELFQGRGSEALAIFTKALETASPSEPHGLRFMLEYGIAQVLADRKKMDEALKHVEAALDLPVKRVDIVPFVYVQLATIAKDLRRNDILGTILLRVIDADKKARMRSGAVDQVRTILEKLE